tara:strand:+ start:160 stop:585 length:426 start_codon:yes stop_codon:yes gene_type:complete
MAIDPKQISNHTDALSRVLFAPVKGTEGPVHPIYATTNGSLMVDTSDPSAGNIEGGGVLTVGTTALELTFTGETRAIIVSAVSANTGTLYIGKSNVTNAGANAFTFLEAGESLTVDYDDSGNPLFVVADAADQSYIKGALI